MSVSSVRAALDVGSNTVRLLVCRVEGHTLLPVRDESVFARLGRGVDASGRLSREREDAALQAIAQLASVARDEGATQLPAVATSAVRDATNGADFVSRVRAETGVEVEILSGEREAELTYLGATLGVAPDTGVLVVDLGGGSGELIAADDRGVQWAQSVKLGSGRLAEKFTHTDPPTQDELRALEQHVHEVLEELPVAAPVRGIYTGGTATHVALLRGDVPDRTRLSANDLVAVLGTLVAHTAAEVVSRYAIKPERAQVLAAGVAALATITDFYGLREITITRYGIREGVVIDTLRREGLW